MSSFGPVGRWRRWPAGAREDVRNEIIRRSVVATTAVLGVLLGMPAAAQALAMPGPRIDGGAGMNLIFQKVDPAANLLPGGTFEGVLCTRPDEDSPLNCEPPERARQPEPADRRPEPHARQPARA